MYEPTSHQHEVKKKTTWYDHTKTFLAVGFLALLAAVLGVYIADYAERTSINYRTSEATEVHKVLGEPYIHLGDNKPVGRVKLGQTFYVHNNYIKTETCHVFVSNVYWGVERPIAHHYSMFTNWFNAGTVEADEVFVASDNLPAGKYRIVKKTISFCNGKEHYSLNFDVPVEFTR